MLHFGPVEHTLRALDSLAALSAHANLEVFILNNTKDPDVSTVLRRYLQEHALGTEVLEPEENLGFAGGHNFLIHHILKETQDMPILLLNNDCFLSEESLLALLSSPFDLTGLTLQREHQELENIGLTYYASGYCSHRKRERDPLLGPSGACLLLTREHCQRLIEYFDEVFDSRFFLYLEDADLCIRTAMLGCSQTVLPEVSIHLGSQGSGGGYSDTVAYYGMRNSWWLRWKYLGSTRTLRVWIGDAMSIMAAVLQGKGKIWVRAYRDAKHRRAEFLEEYTQLRSSHPSFLQELQGSIRRAPFFVPGHTTTLLRRVFSRKASK